MFAMHSICDVKIKSNVQIFINLRTENIYDFIKSNQLDQIKSTNLLFDFYIFKIWIIFLKNIQRKIATRNDIRTIFSTFISLIPITVLLYFMQIEFLFLDSVTTIGIMQYNCFKSAFKKGFKFSWKRLDQCFIFKREVNYRIIHLVLLCFQD